jgi:hypothetical protein
MAFTFNGNTKIITLTSGTVSVSVRDLWSRWNDWLLTSDNSKYAIAMAQVGGNDIDATAGTSIPIYVFLQNGWQLRPQETSHTLNVNDGVLLVDGGGDPFLNTLGSFAVRINYSQPVQAITVNTAGSSGATADDVWDELMESGWTARQMMKIFASVLAGKVSGGGTSTETFRGVNDDKNRVISNVDASGNRTSVTLDPS